MCGCVCVNACVCECVCVCMCVCLCVRTCVCVCVCVCVYLLSVCLLSVYMCEWVKWGEWGGNTKMTAIVLKDFSPSTLDG